MANITKLDLRLTNGMPIHMNSGYLKKYSDEVLMFLEDMNYMRTIDFAKSVLFNEEIKSNNNIEGINDDLKQIDDAIVNEKKDSNYKESKRIINLYRGYKYILDKKEINKDTLRELYAILSNGLLCKEDASRMGKYYREGPVYILKSGRLDYTPYMGIDENKLDYFMNILFEYINASNSNNEIDNLIKSQIIHFYFVYIHPYFDVNGRTSRTTAMWYLLNNEVYPYIIFNRAIALKQKEYTTTIIKAREYGDVTLFLKYVLTSILEELEKEYIISNIKDIELTKEEFQMLEYFLSLNGNLTIKDLAVTYNNFNPKKKAIDIYNEIIKSLIEKELLIVNRETNSYLDSNTHNAIISLNKKSIDIDRAKIKTLNIEKYMN